MTSQEQSRASNFARSRPGIIARAGRRSLALPWIAALMLLAGGRSAKGQWASLSSAMRVESPALNGGIWRVANAEFSEGFAGVLGVVRIQNKSSAPASAPRFYGEYSDARGRTCFALMFDGARNMEKRVGAFLPGESRTLYSPAYYEAPATRPELLVLRLAGGMLTRRPIQTLPTLLEGFGAWGRIEIPPGAYGKGTEPVVDIGLAEAELDNNGTIRRTSILYAPCAEVSDWLQTLMTHERFSPANVHGLPKVNLVLILVRATVSLRCFREKPLPARKSTLVRQYVRTSGLAVVPPVVTISLEPCSVARVWPRSGCYRVVPIGSGFEGPAEGTSVAQNAASTASGPILPKILAPPGSAHCP
jgi:hypothetical protein